MSELLGRITRIQVHRRHVQVGPDYRPEGLVAVKRGAIDSGGMTGWDGEAWLLDVHHVAYPMERNGAPRALSMGFTGHYDLMRERFGDRAADGVAAENIIVDAEGRVRLEDVAEGLVIQTQGGSHVELADPRVAEPCRQFTSYLLGLPEMALREQIQDDLEFLGEGMRGFVMAAPEVAAPVEFAVGDEVWTL
jgi:hypothetical protein